MELELNITCMCHQAKIAICFQTPLAAPIALKICTRGVFSMLNSNLPSDLLSDHASNTSFKFHMHNSIILTLSGSNHAGVFKITTFYC